MVATGAEAVRDATERRPGPYRVMLVDDSVVVRGLFTRTLEQDPEVEVVASVGNGQQAVAAAARQKLDVVVLDIEMPVMDGLTALPKLLASDPSLKIIIASTLTRRSAEITLRALTAGASECLAKPTATRDPAAAADFRRELLAKVKALAAARRGGSGYVTARTAPVALQSPGTVRPELLAIASSTGGPRALVSVLGDLDASVTVPILVTQHMPPTFTTILAEHIARQCNRPCAEAVDGEPIAANRIYIAPGNYHMTVETRAGQRCIGLDDGPAENFCRPAADPMFRSIARVYGARALIAVLTGMGHDGLRGARLVVEAGGTLLAQDEATSVVWGMPGAVTEAGLCSAVLPLDRLAPCIRRILRGDAP
jgi:two-component system, chemotaxis family, protein-glutamate methylesterase/glutaminase